MLYYLHYNSTVPWRQSVYESIVYYRDQDLHTSQIGVEVIPEQ